MPRKQNVVVKYKCLELCCGKIVREDKWLQHCKNFHGFKTKRNEDIKRKPIEYKIDGGKWIAYGSKSDLHGDSTTAASATVTVAEVSENHEPDDQRTASSAVSHETIEDDEVGKNSFVLCIQYSEITNPIRLLYYISEMIS